MINAIFYNNNNFYYSFRVEGHSDYNIAGKDIVCAAVSSAVEMTINAIKNVIGEKINLEIDDIRAIVCFELINKDNEVASLFIKSLCNHLVNISEVYPDNIKIKFFEKE